SGRLSAWPMQGRGDWILCQITSNAYGDPAAVPPNVPDFASGGLRVASFAPPGKLFTAHAGFAGPFGRGPHRCRAGVRALSGRCGPPAAPRPLMPSSCDSGVGSRPTEFVTALMTWMSRGNIKVI